MAKGDTLDMRLSSNDPCCRYGRRGDRESGDISGEETDVVGDGVGDKLRSALLLLGNPRYSRFCTRLELSPNVIVLMGLGLPSSDHSALTPLVGVSVMALMPDFRSSATSSIASSARPLSFSVSTYGVG